MTVRELSQYFHYRRLVADLEISIELIEAEALSSVNLDPMPRGKGNINRGIEGQALALEKAKRQLIRERTNAYKALEQLEKYISTINDVAVKRIFHYRYVSCLTWEGVADAMGAGYTAEAVKKRHYRYLRLVNRRK